MNAISKIKAGFAAAAIATALGTTALIALPAVSYAQTVNTGARELKLSIGEAKQINLGSPVTDVVVADPQVADVDITSNRKLYILAKGPGVTDVVATDGAGRTVYRSKVVVGGNLTSLEQMLKFAMPGSDIKVTTMNNVVLLTGTAAQPGDAAEAEQLANAFVTSSSTGNAPTTVINRIKTATPLQVMLQVRVAEVNRSLSKEITGNVRGANSGVDSAGQPYFFGIGSGRDITSGNAVTFPSGSNIIGGIGRLFGIDVEAAFDLAERNGLTSTLANPNLTTVSGETAEFLAGGSFPIVTSGDNGSSVTYQSYGVSLTYTPVVLADGRISLRIRTEVSDISEQGAVRLGGVSVPATTNRMTETTVEMGSGQSMMIAGLLSNSLGSSVDKMPGLGDIPVLGALFKSNGWRRSETELMIVITPYLVNAVSDGAIRLPTDGIHSIDDAQRVIMGKVIDKSASPDRPIPTIAPTPVSGPAMSTISDAAPTDAQRTEKVAVQSTVAGPGFSFDN